MKTFPLNYSNVLQIDKTKNKTDNVKDYLHQMRKNIYDKENIKVNERSSRLT